MTRNNGQIDNGTSLLLEYEKILQEIEDIKLKIKQLQGKSEYSYGCKNKLFTKSNYEQALKGLRYKVFSSAVPPPEMITIAGYHIEAGSNEFIDFSRNMVEDLSNKVKPYLKKLYIDTVDDLNNKGLQITKTPSQEILSPDEEKLKQRQKVNLIALQTRLETLEAMRNTLKKQIKVQNYNFKLKSIKKWILRIGLAIVLILAITNPSMKQFKEFWGEGVYMSRSQNWIFFSIYVSRGNKYFAILNNFYKMN